jgi:hypothetical protein
MKKLLGIVVLGLLLSISNLSTAFSKTLYKNSKCVEGNCMNGKGFLKNNENKFTYKGTFKKGIISGYGVITHGTTTYEGDFENGKKNGYGKAVYKGLGSYQGHFKDNKKHGKGLSINSELNFSYDGSWENGFKHGQGTMDLGDGFIRSGQYIKDKFIRKIEKITPKTKNIIIPIQINIVEKNEGEALSIPPKDLIRSIKADMSFANKLWREHGFYFDIIKFNKTYVELPNNFKQEYKWLKNNNSYKVDVSRLETYAEKLFNWKKNNNKKAVNIYYYSKKILYPKGAVCGLSSMKHKIKWIIIPFDQSTGCHAPEYTLSHELGHMLGLKHIGDRKKDLMQTGGFTRLQIPKSHEKIAKDYYKKYLKKILK